VRVAQRVRFVGHAQASALRARVLERRAEDALDAAPGVHVLFDGDLVGRAAAELSPDARVEPLGALPENDEADVAPRPPPKRHEPIREGARGADLGIQVEARPEPEEDRARVLVAGNTGIPERAEQDGGSGRADLRAERVGEPHALAEPALRAEIE